MSNLKRFVTLALVFVVTITCCINASAASSTILRSSPTLSDYEAILKAGSSQGEIKINYDVTSSKPATSLGVYSIAIYTSSGTYITTIYGTTSNGLIRTSASSHIGSYSYIGTTGTYYYAKVTVFAETATDYDSRVIVTNTIKAS